jgi:hypothetical protein
MPIEVERRDWWQTKLCPIFSGSDAKGMAEQLFLFVMFEKGIKDLGIELPGFKFNAKSVH